MIRAAFAYFGIVFALGFVLGAGRTLWLAPQIGETSAVLIELPIILAASWLTARRIVLRARLAPGPALATGALAFALLMAAEAVLANILSGQSLSAWFAALFGTPGWIGLAGQCVFALFPWLAALKASGD